MTPKEEAKELYDKFENACHNYFTYTGDGIEVAMLAKQSALIAVDEIIEALNPLLKSGLNNDFDILKLRGFYMEVKQEIERI
jgi:hypothetical protein